MSHGFFRLLVRKFKENGIKECSINYYTDDCDIAKFNTEAFSLDDIIRNPSAYGIKREEPLHEIASDNAPIPGVGRNRVMLLDPVIKSGTITWIFSQEKVGKTLLTLSIAHAVGKGNSEIGRWRSFEPKRVLYVDGEMPGDKLKSHIDRMKLTRMGIAFIVLDHTNSEGDLQGSKVKKRAMDLGLKLELLNKNEISIDFQCDRYGREHTAEKFNLIPCFAASEFSYATKNTDGAVEQTPEQIAGEDKDLVAIFPEY